MCRLVTICFKGVCGINRLRFDFHSAVQQVKFHFSNQQIGDVAYKVAVIGGKSTTDGMSYAAYFVIRTRLDFLSIPQSGGENVKTFTSRCDHRLQIPNLFMAFKRVPLW